MTRLPSALHLHFREKALLVPPDCGLARLSPDYNPDPWGP